MRFDITRKGRRLAAALVTAATLMSTAAMSSAAIAEESEEVTGQPQLVASYDFTGGSTEDLTGDYDMTLQSGAKVEKYGDRNNNEALSLRGNGQYAQLPDELFAELGDSFTMEFAAKSRHDDDRHHFTFTVGKDKTHYLFFYLSTDNYRMVISDNAWSNEQGIGYTALENNNNLWHNYKLVVDEGVMAVWRDGELVGYNPDTGIHMSELGGTTTYIGKSFYGDDDKYWDGAMDDIKIYKGADPVKFATGVTIAGEGVVDDALLLGESDTAQLTAEVTPADAADGDVTWTSSATKVATVDDNGLVKAQSEGQTTITASTMGGASGSITVTVSALDNEGKVQADLNRALSSLKAVTTENLPMAAEGEHGTAITWTTSDASLITGTDADYQAPAVGAADPYRGAGVITRPAYGDGDVKATVTATVTSGEATATGTKEITIKERTRSVPNGAYAAVTFLSDAATTNGKIGEALYESATDGNNFFSFSEINNTNPVIVSDSDTKGLRDPYVLKSHDGDKYYMIATDLKVSAQGWGENQQYGSLKIEAWESTDMVNWTRTNAEDGDTGIKINADNAGMTWAPEAFWDDSLNAYVVFFSTREYTDDTRTEAVTGIKGGAYNEVHYVITRDFRTFTAPPVQWQDTGYSRIDSTVFKIGDYYYRLTKNEENGDAGEYIKTGKSTFLERSKVLTAPTTEASPDTDPETGWQLLDENILPFEGPEAIKLNPGDINQNEAGDAMVIMADSSGYQPYMTSESQLASHDWTNRLSLTEGWHTQKASGPGVTGYVYDDGMPTPTRHGAFVNVPAAVAENMHRWTTENPTTVDPTESSVAAVQDGSTVTATVTAADGGTVAGSVTFSIGEWSRTAKLAADGTASVELPAGMEAGTMHVAYDGYNDGLVTPSAADVAVEATEPADPTDPTDPSDPSNPNDPSDPDTGVKPSDPNAAGDDQSTAIPSTGTAVLGVAAVGLALAGIGLIIQRKRRA